MNFKKYQKLSRTTNIYPVKGKDFVYAALGVASEAGEIAGKAKKIIRDRNGKLDSEYKGELAKEIGDVLWYLSELASELNLSLSDIAKDNIKKLADRKKRNKLKGSGDNR